MAESVCADFAPSTLIVDAADLVKELRYQICGCVSERDMKEIITQVVCVLLNAENGNVEGLNGLPQFNRMRDDDYSSGNQNLERIQIATSQFGFALFQRLKALGAYQDDTFSYFFDQLLGNDLVMSHLPH